jgi:hypothetical protein
MEGSSNQAIQQAITMQISNLGELMIFQREAGFAVHFSFKASLVLISCLGNVSGKHVGRLCKAMTAFYMRTKANDAEIRVTFILEIEKGNVNH